MIIHKSRSSVSAITKTQLVDVTFTAIAEAMEDVTVDVKDNNGNVVEVKALDLVKGETVATFELSAPLATDPTGIWTVNGVKVDLDVKAKIKKVNDETSQTGLYNALLAAGIENVKPENAKAYADEKGNLADAFTTIKEIQDFVNKTNSGLLTADEAKVMFKSIQDAAAANNNVLLLQRLQDNFERVNDDWIVKYGDKSVANGQTITLYSNSTTKVDLDTITDTVQKTKDIQAAIDAINLAETKYLRDTAIKSLDRKDYTKATTALTFVKADETGVKEKANLQKDLNEYNLVLKVVEAKTLAQFSTAYNNLVSFIDKKVVIGTNPFYNEARSEYIKAVKVESDKVPTPPITTAIIETAIATGNTAAVQNVLVKIDAFDTNTTNAKVLEALNELNAITTKAQFDGTKIKTDAPTVTKYTTQLKALAVDASGWTEGNGTPTSTNAYANAVIVLDIIEAVNNPSGASVLANIKTNVASLDDAAKFWNGVPASSFKGLVDLPAHYGLIEENAAAYFADQTVLTDVTAAGVTAAEEKAVKQAIVAINAIEALKVATTDVEANDALYALAYSKYPTTGVAYVNYINLTSAQKLEFAKTLVDNNKVTGADAEATAIKVLGASTPTTGDLIFDEYLNVIDAVNGATTIATMSAALEEVGYKAYTDLTQQQKDKVAEYVNANFPTKVTDTTTNTTARVPFKTFAGINALVDTAIAATK